MALRPISVNSNPTCSREVWTGTNAEVVTTGIRLSARQLSSVQGFLAISVTGGVPVFTAVPSIVGGYLVVTVGVGGGTGIWALDVTLNHSIQQQRTPGAGFIMVMNATPGLLGPQTLAQTYLQGASPAHQMMTITDADGGRVLVDGSTAAATVASVSTLEVRQQDLDVPLPLLLSRRGNFANPAALVFEKARGTFTPDAPADVQANDMLGCIDFYGRVGGAQAIGAQAIASVLSVAGGVLDAVLTIWASNNSVSNQIARFDNLAAGSSPRVALYGAAGELVPTLNNEGHVGIAGNVWAEVRAYTVNVDANVCLGGEAIGGGAHHTVLLPNTNTVMPVPQADQVYLGALNWAGTGGANHAALAISSEELAAAAGELIADTVLPVVFNGVAYYVFAKDMTQV